MNILELAEDYITKYDLNISPEQLFIEFQNIIESHEAFEIYLKENSINSKLEQMQRSKRQLEKRKLFIEWYAKKNQNKKMIKEILIDLSEIAFTSTKTIKNELSREATG